MADLSLIIKLISAGPTISGESELDGFTDYFNSIYAIAMDAQTVLIANTMVKAKITGRARDIILANPQCSAWEDIRTLLLRSLADPRPLLVLTDLLTTAKCRDSVSQFYDYMMQLRGKIMQRYKIDNPNHGPAEYLAFSQSTARIALRQFKFRIREPLRSILEARNPITMEDAMIILRNTGYDLGGQFNINRTNSNNRNGNVTNNDNRNNTSSSGRGQRRYNHSNNNNANTMPDLSGAGGGHSNNNVPRYNNLTTDNRRSAVQPMDVNIVENDHVIDVVNFQ